MLPKPKHLEPQYGEQFQDKAIAEVYQLRPPYPEAVFAILAELITDEPRRVLDVGCGTGDVARRLVERVAEVDAVDFSKAMLEKGQNAPGGKHPNLRWIYGKVEEAELHPPYSLITAGESLHWFDWPVVFPRFRPMLSPNGYLAIVGRATHFKAGAPDIGADLFRIINRYSTNRDFQPYNLVEELEKRNLFEKIGEKITEPVPFTQPVVDYIESFHSRNGLSRERMAPVEADAFDREMRELLLNNFGESLELEIVGSVIWGNPQNL